MNVLEMLNFDGQTKLILWNPEMRIDEAHLFHHEYRQSSLLFPFFIYFYNILIENSEVAQE